ncbi:unnamed protein product [Mucor hiemalis]
MMLYFSILDSTVNKEINSLRTVFNETDYNRFKSELCSIIPLGTSVGNTTKKYLISIEGTEDKKKLKMKVVRLVVTKKKKKNGQEEKVVRQRRRYPGAHNMFPEAPEGTSSVLRGSA